MTMQRVTWLLSMVAVTCTALFRVAAGDMEADVEKAIKECGGRIQRDVDANFKPLIRAVLDRSSVTDATLSVVARSQKINAINLRSTKITNTGLKHLASV